MSASGSPTPPPPLRSMAAATAQLLYSGSRFEMARIEVNGVPTRVWADARPSLRALLLGSAERGDHPAIVFGDERISHADYFRRTATLARRLREDYGVAEGDRVALAMRNYPEWVIAFFAVTGIGAIAVPLNSWFTGPELEFVIRDSGAAVLVADSERLDRLDGLLTDVRPSVIAVRHTGALPEGARAWDEVLGEVAADAVPPEADPAPDDPATLFYTSGTTGLPKGALGSHRNLISNITSTAFTKARTLLRVGFDLGDSLALTFDAPPPVVLCVVPLFHATGAQTVMLPALDSGGTLVLMHRWDAEAALDLIERERVTAVTGVPTMLSQMLASPGFAERDLSSLASLGSGGAPAAPALVARARDGRKLDQALLGAGYGLTECSAIAAVNYGPDYLSRPDSVGVPVPVVDVRIAGPDGSELPPGRVGEIWISGPGVVHGYWRRPEATAATFTDGWLRTGDLGRLDEEGFLYIVDRVKDMILRGGENVYCAEVEAAVHEHPAVADVAVVGVAHEVLGEEVGAVVRPLPGASVTAPELRDFLSGRLASFKIPARIRVTAAELPRNAAGKLLKKRLRDEVDWTAAG
ncbi:class I adenylate-forming enzyme family protein [Actinorugispora endophytica]|uniref:Acyl-CoA synthetase (AMP-forming)/AMP-acid ligase II n=1 Tax=Actinorugispora endophytica TaxID=1605990 RepID=A0A4R6V0V4_9ACTN|nr:AMP-binding protein [Actinorugispora endophytica]TDQ53432.1 acyl-CoA synthetase (AMP-forming)/AMP-acid ligase II [Actinorugispora endophytica]